MTDMMRVYKTLRQDIELCNGNPLHDKDWPCHKADAKEPAVVGPGVPGYFVPDSCQLLFVALAPSKMEVSSKARVRAPFIDVYGKAFDEMLKIGGLYGDSRVGMTTVIKCALNNKRNLKAVCESCSNLLEDEIALARPAVIVCLGEQVAKLLTPELFQPYTHVMSSADKSASQAVVEKDVGTYFMLEDGAFYTAVDRTFFFLPDPLDLFDASLKPKDSKDAVLRMAIPGYFEELKSVLVPTDQWVGTRHVDRLSS